MDVRTTPHTFLLIQSIQSSHTVKLTHPSTRLHHPAKVGLRFRLPRTPEPALDSPTSLVPPTWLQTALDNAVPMTAICEALSTPSATRCASMTSLHPCQSRLQLPMTNAAPQRLGQLHPSSASLHRLQVPTIFCDTYEVTANRGRCSANWSFAHPFRCCRRADCRAFTLQSAFGPELRCRPSLPALPHSRSLCLSLSTGRHVCSRLHRILVAAAAIHIGTSVNQHVSTLRQL